MHSMQNTQTMVNTAPPAASTLYIENLAHSTAHAPATLQSGKYVQEIAAAAAAAAANIVASVEVSLEEAVPVPSEDVDDGASD